MLSFYNTVNSRDEGKERTNDKSRVASGKKDSNEMNEKKGHLMHLICRHFRISTGMRSKRSGLSDGPGNVRNTKP